MTHTDFFAQAAVAYDARDYAAALSLLVLETERNPRNIAAHFLSALCFIKEGRFARAIDAYYELWRKRTRSGRALVSKRATDDLVVDALLAWSFRIERDGFVKEEIARFEEAVRFYGSAAFGGRRGLEMLALETGLEQRTSVTHAVASAIRTAEGATRSSH